MKIVHVAPSAPYNDYWGYQDNLLPKYHKKLGHEVTIITTDTKHENGKIVEIGCADYVLNDGVRVIRLKRRKYFNRTLTGLRSKLEIYDLLKELKPDLIFFHGLISASIFDCIKYKKKINPNCKIVQDNHLDTNNHKSSKSKIKYFLKRNYFLKLNRKTQKKVDKIYGVTPCRKKFAEDYFKISKDKTAVLMMGADDEKIDFSNRQNIRNEIRSKYNITDEDFLIVSGGKLEENKKVIELMSACRNLDRVKLLLFGSVDSKIEKQFNDLLLENKILYVGWLDADKVYNYFFAADLIVFAGLHSVLWEQACASKTPCLFAKHEGMNHLNNGGNSDFIDKITVEDIEKKIEGLLFSEKYYSMKTVAESSKTDVYLYSEIAKKSLEVTGC